MQRDTTLLCLLHKLFGRSKKKNRVFRLVLRLELHKSKNTPTSPYSNLYVSDSMMAPFSQSIFSQAHFRC